jgi:hypothetical protein
VEKQSYTRGVLKAVASGLTAFALAPSGTSVPPPSQPGPWQLVGKAAVSRIGARLHRFSIITGSE